MIRRLIASASLIFLFLLSACSRLNYDIVPHKTSLYHSLHIKVNARNSDNGQKQNFKILLKYDNTRDKMFFLSPLNQIYGLLLLEGEKALLINTKKKTYWQGTFDELIGEIWGVDFQYREFKQLLIHGIVPESKLKEQGLEVTFPEGSRRDEPETLKISSTDLLLKIKISDRKTGRGTITFSKRLKGMKKTGINQLLGEEDEG
jgi:hypothetical protein